MGRLHSTSIKLQVGDYYAFLNKITLHYLATYPLAGSPIACDAKEMVKLAKRLKKENVNVDVINFGEDEANAEKLKSFVETLNGGRENAGSHLVTVTATPHLNEALISSPIIQGEDGSGAVPAGGFEFGVDPNEDPELAMVSNQPVSIVLSVRIP